jgi:hypothetical protein
MMQLAQFSQQHKPQVAQLPPELLAAVLKWVPLAQRLRSGLTCRSFHEAAVAATQQIQLTDVNDNIAESLCEWLQKHTSLSLIRLVMASTEDEMPFLQFSQPCLGLQSLCLSYVSLEDAKELHGVYDYYNRFDSDPAASPLVAPVFPLAALNALTSLQLDDVRVRSETDIHSWTASQLSSLTCLRRLQLHFLENAYYWQDPSEEWMHSEAVGAALGHLRQLTSLSLSMHEPQLDGSALSVASRLSQLQHLQLAYSGSEQVPVRLQDLPPSLTSLSLEQCNVSAVSAGDTFGSSWLLAGLQQLQLKKMSNLPPAALRLMPQLQGITCVEWYPPFFDKQPYQRGNPVSGSHTEQLCSTLPVLQHLKHVELSGCRHPLEAAGYAALTAGTQVTALIMTDWSPPPGAARHMFAPARQLPNLQRLQVRVSDEYEHGYSCYGCEWHGGWVQGTSWALESGDVGRLVACCPALRDLSVVWAGADISGSELKQLLQLTALTRLSVGGECWDNDTVSSTLAQMTGGISKVARAAIFMQ